MQEIGLATEVFALSIDDQIINKFANFRKINCCYYLTVTTLLCNRLYMRMDDSVAYITTKSMSDTMIVRLWIKSGSIGYGGWVT